MERLAVSGPANHPGAVGKQYGKIIGSIDLFDGLPLISAYLILSVLVALCLFIFYMTFVPELPTDLGLTLDHWANIMTFRMLTEVAPNTLIVGFGTTLVAAFFGLPLAWLLNRTSIPLRSTFITLIAVVVIVPGFIKAMGWIMLVNDRIGLFNKAFEALLGVERISLTVVNNPYGIAWVMGLTLTPTMFFLISGPMRALDPTLEEASAVSGVNQWRTLLRVSFPLMWPGTLAGIIYTFMSAISIFEVPALLGAGSGKVPVLASELFYAVRPAGPGAGEMAYGAAGVYGILIAAPSIVALYFYLRVLSQGRRYEVITGKAYRPRNIELGNFRWLGLGFVLLYLLLAVVLPMVVLVWASLLPYLQMPSTQAFSKMTLSHYQELPVYLGGWPVIQNTVLLTGSVAFLVMFFSFMISWVVVRTQVRFRKIMDVVAMLPHAIPGLAFAFALAMLGILLSKWAQWLPFAGTVGIIVIVNVINRLSYGTRVTNAALVQVQRELEECAEVCGAGRISVMWRIILPLIKPSMVYAGLWTALLTFREVSMALFLYRSENQVLSVAVWNIWEGGELGVAAAGAVVMVSVMAVFVLVILGLLGGTARGQRQTGLFSAR